MTFVKSSISCKTTTIPFCNFSLFKYDDGRAKSRIAVSQIQVCKSVLGFFKCYYVNTKFENHLTALTVNYYLTFSQISFFHAQLHKFS